MVVNRFLQQPPLALAPWPKSPASELAKMVPTLHFLPSVAALVISASVQSNCDRFYAVNSGDTCDSIAAQQHVPTFQLQTVNSGTIDAACDNLFPGEGEDCETTYVVQSGDTCVAISSANNISLATLLANNPNVNSDCTNIGVGEVLCVADQIIGAAEPLRALRHPHQFRLGLYQYPQRRRPLSPSHVSQGP
ncbi:hypothetical protein EWM64_g1667 [Hericium alpestre]|uniref:LysM domain-containing protein n=1 Tax=Hericium alpestre TaxID=135208 RepID=A0A4Z0A8U8_9AGAM|nr:hypothetical protein EWM64_g1667 [Hericium alpestre]